MALEKEVQTLTHSGAPATCPVAGTDIGYTLVPLLKIDKRKHRGFWPLHSGFASAWGIKSLKARWGKCNFAYRRIWLNLEFGQKGTITSGNILLFTRSSICWWNTTN